MAIDTETKRRSVAGMTIMALVIAPLADATVSITDSMHITGFYSGITPQAGLQTTAIHILSTSDIEPDHATDSGNNLLLAGVVESQKGGYFGGPANYVKISATGDITFHGTAGLAYGELSAYDEADTIAITLAGIANKVQITTFNVAGPSNNTTPSVAQSHIAITVPGHYFCTVSLHIESAGGGGADTFGFAVYKNNGTAVFENCHGHRRLAGGGGDVGAIILSGILENLAATDTVELWCWNEDSTDDIVIDDVTLTLIQVGGL